MKTLRWSCWLPLVTLVATEVYLREFDGWGAWAAAPMLLVPAILSLAVVVFGVYECGVASRAGRLGPICPMYVLIAALPLLWLAARRFLV